MDPDNHEERLNGLSKEVSRIEGKVNSFRISYDSKLSNAYSMLTRLKSDLTISQTDDELPEDLRARCDEVCGSIKSGFYEIIKSHRDVHAALSKFGKTIDKNFIEDLSSLGAHFVNSTERRFSGTMAPPPASNLYKNLDSLSSEDLLSLAITEHLIRNGLGGVAVQLSKEAGFSDEDIFFAQFSEIAEMVIKLKSGYPHLAKSWLERHSDTLGGRKRLLEYVLAKLEFLTKVHENANNPAFVLECMQALAPFAADFSADFEHVMGSLVFLGQSLKDTPYSDLTLTSEDAESGDMIVLEENDRGEEEFPLLPYIDFDGSLEPGQVKGQNAYSRAAHLFCFVACRQLGLSCVDPLRTAFASGLRILPRLHALQRAIARLNKFGNTPETSSTIPVSVELDPIAHRHNIFHCPVIKEVATTTNTPVRLTCGHAISRDAFSSLPGIDQSKVKCPYCPIETYRLQALDLIF